LEGEAHYNIAPTQQVPVLRQDAKQPVRRLSLMRWGLVPYWAKDPAIGASMMNARSETAATKPAFKEALQRKRCLIPADGFYEWQRTAKSKQPFCFEVREGEMFAFAGLWDRWRGTDGTVLETCTILTTAPNQLLADVHDRMPVILSSENYDLWLDPGVPGTRGVRVLGWEPGFRDAAAATELLKPYDARQMRRYAVSNRVNNVANDDPQCSKPIEVSHEAQAGLF
jgi:putative SOS response-associated peptidase YedK